MLDRNKQRKVDFGFSVSDKMVKTGIKSEFSLHSELSDLPLNDCPTYMTEAIGGICVSGSAVITVFNTRVAVMPGMVVLLLPWQLASISGVSNDFSFTFYRVSEGLFTDCISSMWRLTPDFFFYMGKHIVSEAHDDNIPRFLNYCNLLENRMKYTPEMCQRESIMQLLRVSYWESYALYVCDPNTHIKNYHYTRKEELAYRFLHLILEDHSPDKDVAYYAGKLSVSAKYLTSLIRSLSGHSARDWIVYYTILEIKSLLRESSMDLKTIASRLNFPDQSTLSRFYRHYTGMTPSKYRKSIFF